MDFKALRTALSDVKTVYIEQGTDYLFLANGFFLLRLPRHTALTDKVLKETKRYFPDVPAEGEGAYRFEKGKRFTHPGLLSRTWQDRVTSYIGELTELFPTDVVTGRDYYQRLYTSKTDPLTACWLADMQTDFTKGDARHCWTTRDDTDNQPVLMECHSRFKRGYCDYQVYVMHCDMRRGKLAEMAHVLDTVLSNETVSV